MNTATHRQTCDPQQLDALLDGHLDDAQESDVARHLNDCTNCRDYVETKAAIPTSWSEAGSFLKVQDFDNVDSGHVPVQPLIIQNVLDALAPTDNPEMIGRLGGMEVSGVVGA